jgi:hypothetical protein
VCVCACVCVYSTHFTCFTSTKVQTLTPEERRGSKDKAAAFEKAAQLEALLKQAQDEEAAAHSQVDSAVAQMQAAQMKLSAAIAEAAKEHADAEARSAEASAVEHAAHTREVEAQATAASSRQHADELEIALKRAQLLAASAAARAEQYAGAAAGNATALADKLREAQEWRLEMVSYSYSKPYKMDERRISIRLK